MYSIGLDIGTTSICGILVGEDNAIVKSITLDNDSHYSSSLPYERLQSPERIVEICEKIYLSLKEIATSPCAVGVTGQMHGILYVDKEGMSVSPLYTWQDGRGDLPLGEDTYASRLSSMTGYKVATGYGMVTHYYNSLNSLVPNGATKLATIQDYVVMRLCAMNEPILHPSNAASLGLYDLEKLEWDYEAIKIAGIDSSILPKVSSEAFVGTTSLGDRVVVAIGDNQASVYGSVIDDAIVLNIGTGAQISAITKYVEVSSPLELRPYVDGKYIVVGCSLCGGHSYSILNEFVSSVLKAFGVDKSKDEVYEVLGSLAYGARSTTTPIKATTTYRGTRQDPTKRGSIEGISDKNFDISHLALAVLNGIIDELHDFFTQIPPSQVANIRYVVGSGNAIKKNPLLQSIIAEKFNAEVVVPTIQEDACYGVAKIARKLGE